MNLFKNLFKYRPRPNRLPLEDYTTEIIAYLLGKDKELLNKYLTLLLKKDIEVETYNIKTQYAIEAGRIDLAIFWKSNLTYYSLFVEHKVWSHPWQYEDENGGQNSQIDVYCKFQKEVENSKHGHVALITVMPLSIDYNHDDCYLGNYTWWDISELIKKHIRQTNSIYTGLQYEFIEFLRTNNMAGFDNFTVEELISVKNYNNLCSKCSSIATLINNKLPDNAFNGLNKCFANGENVVGGSYGVIYNDTGNNSPSAAGRNAYLWVFFGLYFNNGLFKEYYPSPKFSDDHIPDVSCSLMAWFKSPSLRDEFRDKTNMATKEMEAVPIDEEDLYCIAFMKRKPLIDFIPEKNHEAEIVKYIYNEFDMLRNNHEILEMIHLHKSLIKT